MTVDYNGKISNRIQLIWTAYYKVGGIIRENTIPISLRRKILNQSINPVTKYVSETWALTKKLEDKIAKIPREE